MRSQRGERAGRCRCPARDQLRASPPSVGMASLAALMWRSALLVALPSAWGAAMPAMAKDPAMREAPSAPGRMAPRPQGRGSAVSPWLTGLLMVASRGRPRRCWPCRRVDRGDLTSRRAFMSSFIYALVHHLSCSAPSTCAGSPSSPDPTVGTQLDCIRILSCGPLGSCATTPAAPCPTRAPIPGVGTP